VGMATHVASLLFMWRPFLAKVWTAIGSHDLAITIAPLIVCGQCNFPQPALDVSLLLAAGLHVVPFSPTWPTFALAAR
jgi:hypothetical protein